MTTGVVSKEDTLRELALVGRAHALLAKRANPGFAALHQTLSTPEELARVLRELGEGGSVDDPGTLGRVMVRYRDLLNSCRAQGWLVATEGEGL